MKGLLYKDILMLWRARILPIYLLVVTVMPFSSGQNMMVLFFPCFFAAILPMTLLSYDEKSRWDHYVQGLPLTRATSVHAKYLIALCLVGTFSLLTTVSRTLLLVFTEQEIGVEIVFLFLTLISFSLVINSLIMPFVFKYGTEKGPIIYYVMLGVFGIVIGIFNSFNSLDISIVSKLSSVVVIVFVLVAAAVFSVSWRLSVFFYERREL